MSSDSRQQLHLRASAILEDFDRAAGSLDAALQEAPDEFIRDAAIQRFEFSFELAWKSIQAVARIEAQEATSPRASVSLAWRNQWISNEASWLDMLDDRNITSHTYRESTAAQVFANLPTYLPLFRELSEKLAGRLKELEPPEEPST